MSEPIALRAKTLTLAFDPAIPDIPVRGADVNEVLRCVCQAFLVSPDELRGKKRHKSISEARLVAYWLLRTLTKMSFPEIGIALNKEHTSVMSGVKACERYRARDSKFKAFTNELATAVSARIGVAT
jgi:chromosomal replication initiator protein